MAVSAGDTRLTCVLNVSSQVEKPPASKATTETCPPSICDGCGRNYSDASLLYSGVEIVEKGVATLTVQRNSEETDSDDDDEIAVKEPLQNETQVRPLEISRVNRMLNAIISWRTPETLDFIQYPQARKIAEETETCDDQPADQEESPVFLPLVHSIAPHIVQRRVLMQQLKSK